MKTAPFDRYKYYSKAVQNPEAEVEFLCEVYEELRGCTPQILCEDFCGTFANSQAWVQLGKRFYSFGVDLDSEPLDYGAQKMVDSLTDEQQKRVNILQANVLSSGLPKGDVLAALNFSYYIFRERKLLLKYFRNVRKRLLKNGVFVIDCFGGPLCQAPVEDVHKNRGFTYYWDQSSFNPIDHHAKFHIHFKRPGEKRRERVFNYDWRLWTIPELRDVLEDAGFKKTHVYWEGSTKRGTGDGNFKRATVGDNADSWIAYIAAI